MPSGKSCYRYFAGARLGQIVDLPEPEMITTMTTTTTPATATAAAKETLGHDIWADMKTAM